MNEPFADALLLTRRLRLRPAAAPDADALFALHADADAMRYWSTPPWTDRDIAVRKIEEATVSAQAGTALWLVIEMRDEARVIGTCSLFNIQPTNRRGEVGYLLARDCWGRGLMREAFAALLDHAFVALDLNRLEADIDPRNTASAGLLEHAGFTRDGVLRERWIVGGEVCDTALYGLLRRDWEGRSREATAT